MANKPKDKTHALDATTMQETAAKIGEHPQKINAAAVLAPPTDEEARQAAESDRLRALTELRVKEIALEKQIRQQYGVDGETPSIEAIAADVFPILLENFLKFGGRCTPNGYSDVTPESVVIITNQAALIAEQHADAMAKWRERKNAPKKPDPDAGQERFA